MRLGGSSASGDGGARSDADKGRGRGSSGASVLLALASCLYHFGFITERYCDIPRVADGDGGAQQRTGHSVGAAQGVGSRLDEMLALEILSTI